MAFTVEGKDGIEITVGTIEGLRLVLEELSATSEETSETSEEDSPLLTSNKLKEGDMVRILTEPGIREAGEFHGHVKGSIGIVTEVVSENFIEVEAPGAASPSETILQYHAPSRLERVEPLGKDANGDDLFEGDYVTGAPSNGYLYTDDSFIMKVILEEDAVGYGIKTNIGVEIVGEHENSTSSFKVDSERFIRLSRDLDEAKAKFSKINGEEVPEEDDEPRMERRFKVGDKVRIVEDSTDGLHVGDVGEIVRVCEDNKNGYDYQVKGDRYSLSMGHAESDLELLKEEEDDLLPVGTKVRLLHDSACEDLRVGEEGTITMTDKGCASGLAYKVRVRDGWRGFGWLRKDDVEAVEEKTFKVGDKVKVTGNSAGHALEIGDIREIHQVDSEEPKYNLSQLRFDHWADTSDIELVTDSEEFEDGDLVRVTETFEDEHGDVVARGTICEYEDWGSSLIFLGSVVLGDNYDKIQLVCRKEDRKDIDL